MVAALNIVTSAAMPAATVPGHTDAPWLRSPTSSADGLLQQDQLLFAHVTAKHARESAEISRVRIPAASGPASVTAVPSDPIETHDCFQR